MPLCGGGFGLVPLKFSQMNFPARKRLLGAASWLAGDRISSDSFVQVLNHCPVLYFLVALDERWFRFFQCEHTSFSDDTWPLCALFIELRPGLTAPLCFLESLFR